MCVTLEFRFYPPGGDRHVVEVCGFLVCFYSPGGELSCCTGVWLYSYISIHQVASCRVVHVCGLIVMCLFTRWRVVLLYRCAAL